MVIHCENCNTELEVKREIVYCKACSTENYMMLDISKEYSWKGNLCEVTFMDLGGKCKITLLPSYDTLEEIDIDELSLISTK